MLFNFVSYFVVIICFRFSVPVLALESVDICHLFYGLP